MRLGLLTVLLVGSLALSGCTGAGCSANQSTSGQDANCSTGASFSYAKQMSMTSATETKTWTNAGSKAMVSWAAQMSSGSGSVTVRDEAGKTVFSKSFSGMGQQADSGLTSAGEPGTWTIVISFTGATGQMSLNMSPA